MFGSLLEALLNEAYAPGTRLPPQRTLAVELGVTMTALREALKRLEQMGLIEVRQGDAMWVANWRERGGLDVLGHLLVRPDGLDAAVLGDVLEARSYMLRELAGLAAERVDGARAARIAELAAAVATSGDDAAAAPADFAFFTEVAYAADNVVFVLILNAIRSTYFAHAAQIPVTARHDELAPLYETLAGAIAGRDVEAARAAAWELASRQRERVGA